MGDTFLDMAADSPVPVLSGTHSIGIFQSSERVFRAFYRCQILHEFHTWGVTFKGN